VPKIFAQVSLVYAFAYLISGGLAYQLLTKQFYVGSDPIFAGYLHSEANPAEWAHVPRWMLPVLLLRGALTTAVLLPFFGALRALTFTQRAGLLFGLMFVLTHLAAGAPSPSNLEGLVYLKSQFIGVVPFLLTQPEMLLQCLVYAGGTAWVVGRPARLVAWKQPLV
jgi:hypothetical protein